MTKKIITFRASAAEVEALDWFADLGGYNSGGAAIRKALRQLIEATDAFPEALLDKVREQRIKDHDCGSKRKHYGAAAPLYDDVVQVAPMADFVSDMPLKNGTDYSGILTHQKKPVRKVTTMPVAGLKIPKKKAASKKKGGK